MDYLATVQTEPHTNGAHEPVTWLFTLSLAIHNDLPINRNHLAPLTDAKVGKSASHWENEGNSRPDDRKKRPSLIFRPVGPGPFPAEFAVSLRAVVCAEDSLVAANTIATRPSR